MNDTVPKHNHCGGCLCGAVCYTINGTLRDIVNCHCKQCQRTHGNYAAYTAIDKKNLILTETRGLKWYCSSEHARRGFCKECGASLFWEPLNKAYMCIAAGTLDVPTGLVTTGHVFVADAGDYYHIADDLEQFSGSMETDS
jgi:hypothetical protein